MTGRAGTAVGFVGLGDIGKAMAGRLVDWPDGLWVYDLAADPVNELHRAGACVATDVAHLAGNVDLVCVMVRDDRQVRDVLDEVLCAAHDRLTVAIHSTVAPQVPAELAEVSASYGVRVVDAAVSGGAMGATRGDLAIMVGGSARDYATCRRPFEQMGSKVVHAGPVGAGTRMKLARNLVHFAAFTAATEAQRLAEAAGIDLTELGEVVRHTDAVTGGPGAIMHRETTAPLARDDFWFGVFDHVRALGEKDLHHVLDLAGELEVNLPMAAQALSGLARGLGLPAQDREEADT